MSLEALKGNSNLNKLLQQAKTETKKETYGDDRLWKPEVDKSGMDSLLLDFFQHPKEKIFHGLNSGIMPLRAQPVNGILKIH